MNNDKSPGYVETEVEAAKKAVLAVYPKAMEWWPFYDKTLSYIVNPPFNTEVDIHAGKRLSADFATDGEAWIDAASHIPNPHPPVIDTTEAVQRNKNPKCHWCNYIIQMSCYQEWVVPLSAIESSKHCLRSPNGRHEPSEEVEAARLSHPGGELGEPIVPENPNSDKHHVAAKAQAYTCPVCLRPMHLEYGENGQDIWCHEDSEAHYACEKLREPKPEAAPAEAIQEPLKEEERCEHNKSWRSPCPQCHAKTESPQAEGVKSVLVCSSCGRTVETGGYIKAGFGCNKSLSQGLRCEGKFGPVESQPSSLAGSGDTHDDWWQNIGQYETYDVPREQVSFISWNAARQQSQPVIDIEERMNRAFAVRLMAFRKDLSAAGLHGHYNTFQKHFGEDIKANESQLAIEPLADSWWISEIAENKDKKFGCHLVEIAKELQQFRNAQKDLGK